MIEDPAKATDEEKKEVAEKVGEALEEGADSQDDEESNETTTFPDVPHAPSPQPPPLFPQARQDFTVTNLEGGAIIGLGGSNLHRIRNYSGAHVIVAPWNASNARLVTVTGSSLQCEVAVRLLRWAAALPYEGLF